MGQGTFGSNADHLLPSLVEAYGFSGFIGGTSALVRFRYLAPTRAPYFGRSFIYYSFPGFKELPPFKLVLCI